MAADAYEAAHEKWAQLIAHLHSPEAHQMSHSDLEALLEVAGRALLRRLLQAHLDERSPGTVAEPVRGADGRTHTHQRTQTRRLMTIFGEVEVTRTGSGGHGIERRHPLDATLHVPPEHYAPGVRHRVAVEAAKTSFDDVVATIATTTGAHVPQRQAEQLVERAAQDFEAFDDTRRCATLQEAQGTSNVLVISADGKGVPMRQADLRAGTRQAAEAHPSPRGHRRKPGARAQQTDGDGGGRLYHQAMGPYPRRHRARVAANACGHCGPPAPRSQARVGLARTAADRGDGPGL
jgi:hypothetical protein